MTTKRTDGEGYYRQRTHRRENAAGKVTERKFWECQITLPDGKRKSLYAPTLAELKRKHKETKRLAEAGVDVSRKPDTMAAFLQNWLADVVKPTTRPRTEDSYRSVIRLHIEPAIGHHKLRDLKQPHVDAMLRTMSDKGLSPRSVAYARAILRAALTYAVRAGMIDRNAAQYAKPPARKQIERAYLTAEHSMRLLETAREHDAELIPLLTTALYTGLRIGELAGLRWEDVDLANRQLRVRQTVYWIKGAYGFGEPKTPKSARTLTLPRPVVTALQEQSDRQAFQKRQAAHRWRPFDLVFSSVLGTPLDNSNVNHRLRKLLLLAGYQKADSTCFAIPARRSWSREGFRYVP